MNSTDRLGETHRGRGYLGLLGLIAGLAAGGAALYYVGGPPRLPSELPGWDATLSTLRGSYLPPEVLAYLLMAAAWAVWLWIVAAVMLRLLVLCAEVLSHGATWTRSLRRLSDLVTPPLVRRLVDSAMVAIVVVNLVGRNPSLALASTMAPVPPVAALTIEVEPISLTSSPERSFAAAKSEGEYIVRSGDTLWNIAEHFYGTGHEYPRVVAANLGRQMPDGRRFTQAGVIHPGWVLRVPPPGHGVETVDGAVYYVVEKGDTLRGIATRLLRSESRWPEVFELNKGVARLGDRRVLTDPGLIWPGLRLRLPPAVPEHLEAASQEAAPKEDAEVPVSPAMSSETESPPPRPSEPVPDDQALSGEPPGTLEPEVQEGPAPAPDDPGTQTLMYGAAGLAVAVAGGVVLFKRRRVRRSLDEPPVRFDKDTPLSTQGFTEGELTRTFAHRLHGNEAEPIAAVAAQLMRFLDEQGMAGVSVLAARQGRDSMELTLDADLGAQANLLENAGAFASRLGGSGRAALSADRDVLLHLSRLRLATLAARVDTPAPERLCLLPMGLVSGRETLYANWPELGHILIAGAPGAGVDILLSSLLATLTARRHPDELALYVVASRRTLPAELGHLPHLRSMADPADPEEASAVLGRVRAMLLSRMRGFERPEDQPQISDRHHPEVVLVVGEATELSGDNTLETIALHGPSHGVRLLAATTDLAAMEHSAISHFQTKMVLQTVDDEESIRLLGRPDAADLGMGDYLLRIDGRVPIGVRGFRVSPEHLAELVRLMRAAYDCKAAGNELESVAGGSADNSGSGWSHAQGHSPGNESSEDTGEVGASLDTEPSDEPISSDGDAPMASDGSPTTPEIEESDPSPRHSTDHGEDEGDERADGHSAGDAATTVDMPEGAAGQAASIGTALIQISCFGGFTVTSGENCITPNGQEGTSFKAWEVLAYLACQPDGAVSKEKLLEALWPEVDEDRASNRMRVAMARLRSLLAQQVPNFPSEAVRCERDGTCRLDTVVILSDAHRFISLCRSASRLPAKEAKAVLEQARALYGGDLLDGTAYVWADERSESGLSLRESYREEYYRATQRIARLHYQGEEPAKAMPLYRALLKAEPTLEDVVRELYRCYGQLGDLGSLIREDRRLRQALRDAYCDPDDPEAHPEYFQPEKETMDLFARIRLELEEKSAQSRMRSRGHAQGDS